MFLKSSNQPAWISFFIKGTGIFCLLHFMALLPDLFRFIGEQAIVIDDITVMESSSVAPSVHSIWEMLQPVMTVHKNDLVIALVSVYIMALVSIVVFRRPVVSSLIAILLKIIINNSMDFYLYGLDGFETIALFYCFVFSHYENEETKGIRRVLFQANLLKFLQLHLCIVYFFGGLGKLLGHNWWNGESIWKALHLYSSPSYLDDVSLAGYGTLWTALGIATFTLELLYPIGINIPKTRKFFLCGVLTMHAFIGIFIGLHFFAAFMIFLNISAYLVPFLKEDQTKETSVKSPSVKLASTT